MGDDHYSEGVIEHHHQGGDAVMDDQDSGAQFE